MATGAGIRVRRGAADVKPWRKYFASGGRFSLLVLVGVSGLAIMGAQRQETMPPPARLTIVPSAGDFGAIPPGPEPVPRTFKVANADRVTDASATLPARQVFSLRDPSDLDHEGLALAAGESASKLTVDLETGEPDQFVITNDECTGKTLFLGQTCTVDVAFKPTQEGSFHTCLVVGPELQPDDRIAVPVAGAGLHSS